MRNIFQGRRIFAYSLPVDMRKSFDGLLALTTHVLKQDPLSESAFVFTNRRKNLIKILFWDRTGFCIYSKRLERGRFGYRCGELEAKELELILDGIAIRARQSRLSAIKTVL